jgi:hypothetical protein
LTPSLPQAAAVVTLEEKLWMWGASVVGVVVVGGVVVGGVVVGGVVVGGGVVGGSVVSVVPPPTVPSVALCVLSSVLSVVLLMLSVVEDSVLSGLSATSEPQFSQNTAVLEIVPPQFQQVVAVFSSLFPQAENDSIIIDTINNTKNLFIFSSSYKKGCGARIIP